MECLSIPQVGYAQFAERLNKEILAKRIPVQGSLELTFRCNLRCVHCYCNLAASDREAVKNELTTGEIYHTLDQIAAAGCLWLLITCGEPLLRRDFQEIYAYAKKRGFVTTVITPALGQRRDGLYHGLVSSPFKRDPWITGLPI